MHCRIFESLIALLVLFISIKYWRSKFSYT